MSLRQLAESDLAGIVEDDTCGFGMAVELIDPSGYTNGGLTGLTNDITSIIDPETGQAVTGRSASVAIRITTLQREDYQMPRGVLNAHSKPWIVKFKDINGGAHKFKVVASNPDRALGLVTLELEAYV